MKSFKEFVNEDKKGALTVNGNNLISKFITISNVSGIITDEVRTYDTKQFNKPMFSIEDDLEWDVEYNKTTHLIHVNFTIDSPIKHSGVLKINPILGTIESTISTKS